jgi:GNAT superfamily N-acetyltransferase
MHLEISEYLSIFMAYEKEEPVCTGWVYFHPKSQFASLYGGATQAEFRGKGYYTAVVAARLEEAARRGRRFITTGANEMSRPILMRRGFMQLTTCWDYEWMGG